VSNPNITFNLAGRRALVTGSASGIGRATAELLARSGARVAMNDRAADTLGAVVSRMRSSGLHVDAVPGDLGESLTAAQVACRAAEQLGGLDYLINNAGAPFTRTPIPPAELEALTDDFWDRILRVNLMSAFWMTKALAGALRASRGAVVNNVSIAAFGRWQQRCLRDGEGRARGPNAGTRSWARLGGARQRYRTGVRKFRVGMLIR